ncbi:hypothetical protein ACLMJK_005500 [Lecanora helva]
MSSNPPKNIIIIGASLTGLLHALSLLHLPHPDPPSITLLESTPTTPRLSHMAGIGLASHIVTFLSRHLRTNDGVAGLGIESHCLQTMDMRGRTRLLLRAERVLSCWEGVEGMLRGGFLRDADKGGQGRGRLEMGWRVVGVEVLEGEGKGVRVRARRTDTAEGERGGEERVLEADMVIGADGHNSIVRNTFMTGAEKVVPEYAGYVAWRGVVPESAVSEETRRAFQHNVTYFLLEGRREHVIVYHIPGPSTSLTPGTRSLNFCWYANIPASALPSLTTDTSGYTHHTTVPSGLVPATTWSLHSTSIHPLLPAPFAEVLSHIHHPFLQVIRDYHTPRAAFADGRVLLVGDARTLLRPHIAFSTNQAAFDVGGVERVVKGEVGWREWERESVGFSRLHWRRSRWFGEWFQRSGWLSWWAGGLYWWEVGMDGLRRRGWWW